MKAYLRYSSRGRREKKKRVNVEGDFDCHWAEIGLKRWAGEGDFPREGASRSQLEYGRLKHTEKILKTCRLGRDFRSL